MSNLGREERVHKEIQIKLTSILLILQIWSCVQGRKDVGLTSDVDIGRRCIQGCWSPGSAAVAWRDAFERGENMFSIEQSTTISYIITSRFNGVIPGTGSW